MDLAKAPSNTQTVGAEEEDQIDAAPLQGVRILLAEDHPVNRRVVELILGAAGASLTSVENGADAVNTATCESFDLILMDMQMPVMDGLTAIAQIKALEATGDVVTTPIYVLSANAMPEDIAKSMAAGADGHISKPIEATRLLDQVCQAITAVRSTELANVA